MISIPVLFVLLVILTGVANYILVLMVGSSMTRYGVPSSVVVELQKDSLFILLLGSLVAALCGFLLVRTILRPIRDIAGVAADVASGNLDSAETISGGVEIRQLGENFSAAIRFLRQTAEEREALLAEALTPGSLQVDPEGHIISIDPRALEILGLDRSELVGRSIDSVDTRRSPSAAEALHYCRYVLSHPSTSSDKEKLVEIAGPERRLLSISFSVLRNRERELVSTLFHFRDVSHVHDLNQLFSRGDHLAALGTFTMGLSHELRNPLATLKGTVQLLAGKVGPSPEYKPFLDRMVREVDRLNRLVSELYDFSSSSAGEREATDISALAMQTMAEVVPGIPEEKREGCRVVTAFARNLPAVRIQPERFRRAVGNVLLNAFDHTPSGGLIRVETGRTSGTGQPFLAIFNSSSNIEAKDLDRIFEPFYSTKPGGTGLGLSIASQIASQNDCALTAALEGDGIRFQFTVSHSRRASQRV